MEKRLGRRFELEWPVRVYSDEQPVLEGVTLDISVNGLQLVASKRFRPYQRLILEIQADSHRIECIGRVSRVKRLSRNRYSCSLWFSSFTGKGRTLLTELLMEHYLLSVMEDNDLPQTLTVV